MQVERTNQQWFVSGERVSNALVTCPKDGDNRSKDLLIPDNLMLVREA